MFGEEEIRIKTYANIVGERSRSEIISNEGDRGSDEFVTLLRSGKQDILL